MKQLSKLQSLVESARAPKKNPLAKMLLKLEDEVEKAYASVQKIREQIQSQTITDYLKAEGFKATESKGVKTAVEAAYEAMRELEEQMLDLIQSVGMHENMKIPPEDV